MGGGDVPLALEVERRQLGLLRGADIVQDLFGLVHPALALNNSV